MTARDGTRATPPATVYQVHPDGWFGVTAPNSAPGLAAACLLALALLAAGAHAGELRIAAWSLEHPKDMDREGCIPREAADYASITRQVEALDLRRR